LRLILDAHLSGRAVASALRESGHDVLAIDEHPELQGLDDAGVLERAVENHRILITADVKDFMPLLRLWAGERRSHTGCMLIASVPTSQFGELVRRILKAIEQHPNQGDWEDLACFLSR
jgi:predicted nuclease of predicted toxin-antitoxin system